MGKEVKIGLSVIAVLLCVFGGVLFVRLRTPQPTPAVAKKSSSDKSSSKEKKGQTERGTGRTEAPFERREPAAPSFGRAPTLGVNVPTRDQSPDDARDQSGGRDGWSSPMEAGAPSEDLTEEPMVPEEQAPPTDRYGQRSGMNTDFNAAPLGRRYGENTVASDEPQGANTDPAISDPAEAADVREPEREMGQPGDGYRIAEEQAPEENASGPAELAENDPFPAASRLANRSAGGLQTSAAEVELAPIAQSPPEEIADDQTNAPPAFGQGYRNKQAPAFSPVSSRQGRADNADISAADADDLRNNSGLEDGQDFGDSNGAYVVQASDSFASISKKVYGSEGYFQALHEFNRERFPNPDLLDVGDEVAIPDVAVLQQNYPQLCPKPRKGPERRNGAMMLASQPAAARGGQVYLVAEGDTLFDIAKRQLGKASRWKEIYELNQDRLGEDFNYLSPGMELMLPGDRVKPDPIADRPLPSRIRR